MRGRSPGKHGKQATRHIACRLDAPAADAVIDSERLEKADRTVIITNIALLGFTWPVELTLANRNAMGFRMLLGRQAFRRRFLVDGGRSACFELRSTPP